MQDLQIRPEFFEAVNEFLVQYRFYIGGFLGLITLTCLLFFIYFLMMVGFPELFATRRADYTRTQALHGILTSGISIAVLGSIDVWYTLFLKTIILS